jgi:uncharacterized repeat protein (TIGR02543 family)
MRPLIMIRSFRAAFFILLLAFILFFPPPSKGYAVQVTLAWDASTDPNVVGYKIHYGTASGNYPAVVNVGNKTTYTITNLPAGTVYYFAATGYDSSGQESGYSNEVVYPPPSACTFSLSPGSYSSSASGGARTVQVATQSGCAWTATSNVSWLIITSNSARTGSATVNYSISANSSAASRSGTMTIAGKVFTVSQSGTGTSCSYAISPTSKSFTAGGGTGTVNVTAGNGCPWNSSSNASWISILSGGSRTGNGTVSYSVSPNPNGTSRTGTISLAGKILTINQTGASQYSLTVAEAGNGNGTVTANPAGTAFAPGTVVTLTAAPDGNSDFAGWSGGCSGTSPTCKVTMNSNTSVTATFTREGYTITAVAGANGSIFPSGTVTVGYGASQTFTIRPYRGYRIVDVKVDGVSVGSPSTFSFGNVRSNHTIEANFAPSYRTYWR